MSVSASAFNSRRWIVLLGAVFFASGFSALLYQVVWQRMLGLFTGSDVQSVTIITGAYLGGLGVGGLIGGAVADRLSSRGALGVYAACNLAIAVFAVLSRILYYDVLFLQFNALADTPTVMLIVVFLSLLIPTTLMGLSLPLISRAAVRQIDGAARSISRLYAINTLGAGIGAAVSNWLLIGWLGFEAAVYIGAVINLGVGATAWIIAWTMGADSGYTPPPATDRVPLFRLPASVWGWCALVFASGFIFISLEIVWFRMLDFVLKSSAYTFGHVLTFFLIGDALGSLIGARVVHRIRSPRHAFLLIQVGLILFALVVTWVIASWAADTNGLIGGYIETFDARIEIGRLSEPGYLPSILLIYLGIPALVVLPAAVMVGFYFPLTQKAIQTDLNVVGQRVAFVEVANIAGNTAGSIITGLILLEFLGTPGTLRLLGVIGVLFGAALLFDLVRMHTRIPRLILRFVLVIALIAAVIAFPELQTYWRMMHAWEQGYFDAAEDSTGVSAMRQNEIGIVNIWANGRNQGDIPFRDWHTFLGALPVLVHPDPRSALAIGIGSAGTPYGIGVRDTLERIDAVELIAAELDVLARFSADPRGEPLTTLFTDPRYRLIVGDGRRVLAQAGAGYDVIVSDALLPYSSGAGLLNSREFYAMVRAKLADGGLFAQWRPTDQSEATFTQTFPYVVSVAGIVLLGSNQPIVYDLNTIMPRLDEPLIRDYLQRGFVLPGEFSYWLLAGELAFWSPDDARSGLTPLTDLFPRDEYYLNNPLGTIHFPVDGNAWSAN